MLIIVFIGTHTHDDSRQQTSTLCKELTGHD